MVQDVCIYAKYMQWNMCMMCKKRLLILWLVCKCCGFRVICWCVVHFWSSLDWLLVCWSWVWIQRISRNSRELWVNCAKSGWFAPIFWGSLSKVRGLKHTKYGWILTRNAWNSRNSQDMWVNWVNFAWFAGILGSSLPLVRHLKHNV